MVSAAASPHRAWGLAVGSAPDIQETARERWLRRAVLAGSLALGLVAGGGVAYGYWNLGGSATPVALTSGTFDLSVNGQLINQQGGTYNWNAFSGAQGLYPLESWAEQVSLSLANNSTGAHAYLVATISAQATNVTGFVSSGSETAGQHLGVAIYQNATASNSGTKPHRSGTCSGGTQIASTTLAALSSQPITLLTTSELAPGASTTVNLCVAVTVDSSLQNPAVTGMPGGAGNFSFVISGQQVQP